MKPLEINPETYEITLNSDISEDDPGLSDVTMMFGDNHFLYCFNAKEAEAVGKWFTALAKELKSPKKTK